MSRLCSATGRFVRSLCALAFAVGVPLAPLNSTLAVAAPTKVTAHQVARAAATGKLPFDLPLPIYPTRAPESAAPAPIAFPNINLTVPAIAVPSMPVLPLPHISPVPAGSPRIQVLAAVTYVVSSGVPCAAGVSEPSIDAALATANSGDTIVICPKLGGWGVDGSGSNFFNSEYLVNQNNLTIVGFGNTPVAIDAAMPASSVQRAGVFAVRGNGDTLRNLTLRNAHSAPAGTGAAVTLTGTNETLDAVTFKGSDIGAYVAGGTTLLKGVSATTNARGLLIDTGSATATNSHFDSNSAAGAQVTNGGSLTTNTAAGPTTFSSNVLDGIYNDASSAATITLDGTTAALNQVGVGVLGGGTLTTANSHFDANSFAGIRVSAAFAPMALVLDSSTASANTQVGVFVTSAMATTLDANGLTTNLNHYIGILLIGTGALTPAANGLVNVTADSNGSHGLDDDSPGSVVITASHFDLNGDVGIVLGSSVFGPVQLTAVTASRNLIGLLDNTNAPLTCTDSTFDNNAGPGGGVGIFIVGGILAATLTNTNADANGSAGLIDTSDGLQTIAGGSFSNNDLPHTYKLGGLAFLGTRTPVTFSNLTANNNGGSGLYYAAGGAGTITGTGINTFDGNNTGILIDSGSATKGTGAVSLAGITADNNKDDGLHDANTGSLTIANSRFSNNGSGLLANNGLQLDASAPNGFLPRAPVGAIQLSNVTANNNSNDGILFQANGSIAIDGGSFTANGRPHNATGAGIEFGDAGVATIAGPHISNVTADGNDFAGLFAGVPTGFSSALTIDRGHFDHNAGDGILDSAKGPITVTGLAGNPTTANDDGNVGIELGGYPYTIADLTANYLQADRNGNIPQTFGTGLAITGIDTATVGHSNFDDNLRAGAVIVGQVNGGSLNFQQSSFDGNASGNNGVLPNSGIYSAGIFFASFGDQTLTVTGSDISGNGNDGFGGSGLAIYAYDGTLTVHLQANTITGNNTTQALNAAGTDNNRGGITVGSGAVILDTTPAAASGPYNHISDNGVGVVITNDHSTFLSGNLTANDITHNKQAAVEIVGTPDLSGGLSVLRNSIYGSVFGAVLATVPPALAAQPASPPYPYYGYVNFGPGSGLNLDGNYFGVNTPSTLAVPAATIANYVDIGGNHLGAGPYITLGVTLNSPLTPAPANSTIAVQATATLNDGAGNVVLDGTPVNFFVGVGPTVAAPSGSANTTNGVAVGTFTVVTPPSPGAVLKLWATAPDRAITVTKAATSITLQSSVNPSAVNQSVTFTAHVTSTAGTPTGTVTFTDASNGNAILAANVALVGGVASVTTSALTQGSHTIVATYSGDANFATSTGSVTQLVRSCSVSAFMLEGTEGTFNDLVASKPALLNTNFASFSGQDGAFTLSSLTVTTCTNPNSNTAMATVTGVASGAPSGAYTLGDNITLTISATGAPNGPQVVIVDNTHTHSFTLKSVLGGIATITITAS
jgi:Bacterial Ig-like domain (group 3)